MKTHSRTKKYYRLTMRLKTYDSSTFTIGTIQIPFELSQFIERKLTVVYLLYTFFIIHLVLVLIQQCFNFKVNDIIWYHFISFHSRVFIFFCSLFIANLLQFWIYEGFKRKLNKLFNYSFLRLNGTRLFGYSFSFSLLKHMYSPR